MIEATGVCSDMSGLFAVMLRSQGITCRYIDGTALNMYGEMKPHAWNQVNSHEEIWDYYNVTNHNTILDDNYKSMIIK